MIITGNPPFFVSMATAAKFVQPIPILAYLVPLDVDVIPIKFHQFLFGAIYLIMSPKRSLGDILLFLRYLLLLLLLLLYIILYLHNNTFLLFFLLPHQFCPSLFSEMPWPIQKKLLRSVNLGHGHCNRAAVSRNRYAGISIRAGTRRYVAVSFR
jgi:hypothetical protein